MTERYQVKKDKSINSMGLAIGALIGGVVLVLLFFLLIPNRSFADKDAVEVNNPSPEKNLPGLSVTIEFSPTEQIHPADALEDEIVFFVNQNPTYLNQFENTLAVDRAMAGMIGQTVNQRDVLDRMVNSELVWQASQKVGYALKQGEADASIEAFLEEHGQDMEGLEKALQIEGVSLEAFTAYYQRLILVDRYSRQQAEISGISVTEYIHYLQKQAQISFSPQADRIKALALEASQIQPRADSTALAIQSPEATPSPLAAEETLAVDSTESGLMADQIAPGFELPIVNMESQTAATLQSLRGRPVALTFFATWCPYCRRQMPVLVQAAQDENYQAIQFVGVDVGEARELVLDYIQTNGIPFPVFIDEQSTAAGIYQVSGFPTTFFLDSEGRIAARHIGLLSIEDLLNYLDQLKQTQ